MTGTTSAFAVPTQFRGDKLQTVEATYAEGTAAGPNDWTTSKEYDVAYLPDYTANTVALDPAPMRRATGSVPAAHASSTRPTTTGSDPAGYLCGSGQ